METIKVGKEKEQPLLFSHFFVGSGSATVALVELEKDLHFGVSFCAPQDMFSRARGRELARQRLRVHLQRRANGLQDSKQAGSYIGAASGDGFKKEDLPVRLKGSVMNRSDQCMAALMAILGSEDKPQWAPESHLLVKFRAKRKKNTAG